MKKQIKFIYFDVGGVIFRWREIFEAIAPIHNKTVDEMLQVFIKYDIEACRGQITSNQLWKKMSADLQLKNNNFDFFKYAMDRFVPIIEMHKLIEDLSKDYQIGLLTNIHPGVIDHAMRKKHIPNLNYSVIIQSCLIGMVKPEKQIFEYARKKAKVEHEEIFYVDDFEINIRSAKELGWETILFETDNPKKSIKEIKKLLDI